VGRVESVRTDPPAKGLTGPFCFIHLQMRPRPSVVLPGASTESSCPAGRRAVTRSPGCCSSRSGLLLDRAWGRDQEAEREPADPKPSSAGPQDIVYNTRYVSHCTGCRFNLVHIMPCPESPAGVR
jgi:hypothetical protein